MRREMCKIQIRKVPFSSEDVLLPLAFRPIFLLDHVFFLSYTLTIKKKILIKIFNNDPMQNRFDNSERVLKEAPPGL